MEKPGHGFTFHDVFGIGVEILTAGHVFHLNFTNARNILENRFLAHTTGSWGEGQFRWGFTPHGTLGYSTPIRRNKSIRLYHPLDLTKIKLFLNTMLNGELACLGNVFNDA